MFLKNPLMIYPTLRATIMCFQIMNKKFPKIHHLDNLANAFRHALWNALLIHKGLYWNKNLEKVVLWTQKITNWHEEFAPNESLEKAMDLHNNKRGQILYIEMISEKKLSIQSIIIALEEYMQSCKKIETLSDIEKYSEHLVYLHD